ncbi:hypothetical protein [Oryzobacter telluris]|uniref:hypothetical protein n=1 Tax=Oryzobacter telluris TaxID=3149179 RepID=UPI00370D7176
MQTTLPVLQPPTFEIDPELMLPSDAIMEDIWEVSEGDLAQFIVAAHLSVIDFRDLRVWADDHRKRN